jgi:hypothetical protein
VTLVCCWLDKSYGRHRVTAIADSRAADYRNNAWHPRSDMTVKLFRVPVKCHYLVDLDPDTGTWREPYYQTEIAIGFAGYCFEAMTIIILFCRAMEQLVSIDPEAHPLPERNRISAVLEKITNDYFTGHSNPQTQRVEFLLFGFSSEQVPWVAVIRYVSGGPATIELLQEMIRGQVYSVGDGAGASFRRSVEDVLGRIRKHSERLRPDGDGDEHELEKARHSDAQKKAVEENAWSFIESMAAQLWPLRVNRARTFSIIFRQRHPGWLTCPLAKRWEERRESELLTNFRDVTRCRRPQPIGPPNHQKSYPRSYRRMVLAVC